MKRPSKSSEYRLSQGKRREYFIHDVVEKLVVLRAEPQLHKALQHSSEDNDPQRQVPMIEFDWVQYLKQRGDTCLRREMGDAGIHAFFAIAAVGEVDLSGIHDFWKVDFLALRSDGLCVRYHPSKTH